MPFEKKNSLIDYSNIESIIAKNFKCKRIDRSKRMYLIDAKTKE